MKKFSNESEKRDYVNILVSEKWLRDLYKGFDDCEERIKQKRRETERDYDIIAKIADSWKVEEGWRDFWFAWYFGDNDFWDPLITGADQVGDYFCESYRSDVWDLAYAEYNIQHCKDILGNTEWMKKRYKDRVEKFKGDYEKSIRESEDYLRNVGMKRLKKAKVFHDKKCLMASISHIGCSILSMQKDNPNFAEEFQFNLRYMMSGKAEHVAIGKEEVMKLLQCPENMDLSGVDRNGECLLVNIVDGEIKLCRTI